MLRPCEILSEGMLKAALRGQLPAEGRAALLRHLGEPCEACLDLLECWTTEEMLTELHASDDLLSWAERERVFPTASAGLASARPPLRVVPPETRRPPRLAWAAVASAAAVALFTLVTLGRPWHPVAKYVLKGTSTPAVTLFALAGSRSPTPHIVRALPAGGPLVPGELLLLRIRLDARAWIYLLSQKQCELSEVLWPLNATGPHEPGEFEVAESGTALAIDPQALGTDARLLLIASPKRIDARRLQIREPLRTRSEVERAFPGCGVDLLPVIVEPER